MRHAAPLSPALVVAGANTAADVGANVTFEYVQRVRQRCGCSDGPWHTAFVHHVGYDAHYTARAAHSTWPLPATGDCNELAALAVRRGVMAEKPMDGDILLLWSAHESRFMRSGIVVGSDPLRIYDDPAFDCFVVEGDTTAYGAPWGRGVHRLRRRIRVHNGHRFLRWVDLEPAPAVDRRARRPWPCVAELMAGTTRRSAACHWPHAGMSGEDELLFDRMVSRHASFVRNTAQRLVRDYELPDGEVDPADLVQEALINIWCMGPRRALARGDRYVRTAAIRRMKAVIRERRP